jgi:hypothetical protein
VQWPEGDLFLIDFRSVRGDREDDTGIAMRVEKKLAARKKTAAAYQFLWDAWRK